MASRRDELRIWRLHPVLFQFAVGATLGLCTAVALIFRVGHIGTITNQYLLMLWPTSILGVGFLDGQPTFVVFVRLVELVGNAVLYGVVFATPIAVVITIRRSFGKPERPTSIGGN